MSSAWSLLPLGMDESDLVMLLLALLLLAILVIAMFMVLPWYYAGLGTGVIIFSIYYGVRKLRQEQASSE